MYSESTLHLQTPIGKIKLEFQGDKLLSLIVAEEMPDRDKILTSQSIEKARKKVLVRLKNYFSSAVSFNAISLAAEGTDFQRKVWSELMKIPLGETRTYGDIAKKINSGPRAVGNACRKNPIQIIIPCHRVISAKDLGGYAGETNGRQLNIKRWLLSHEGVNF